MLWRLINCIIIRPRRSRTAAAYGDQTFPWTICRSVGPYVGLSSALWKNGGSDPDAVWHQMSNGSRDEAGSGVWRSVHGKGYFWGRIWCAPLYQMGTLRRTCATAPRRDPLPKLLWVIIIILYDTEWRSIVKSIFLPACVLPAVPAASVLQAPLRTLQTDECNAMHNGFFVGGPGPIGLMVQHSHRVKLLSMALKALK